MTVPVLHDGTDPIIPLNYLDALAEKIYWLTEPSEMYVKDRALYRIYALLALAKGKATTMRDIHDAWSAWKAGENPHHRSLVPFEDLPQFVQEYDRKYMDAVHEVCNEL